MKINKSNAEDSARNLLKIIAAGAAAHSGRAKEMASRLLAAGSGETKDFQIADVKKLHRIAQILDTPFEGKSVNDVAKDVANKLLEDFSRQKEKVNYIKRAPQKTQERWRKFGILPCGIDKEIGGALNPGNNDDCDHLLFQGLKTALSDGWGSSMISTDLADVFFGTPKPVKTESSFGIFKNRKEKIMDVEKKPEAIAGFSHEYIEYMQGGTWRASFRPLNDAVISGRIRGIAGLADCDNAQVPSTGLHKYLAAELIKNDVLIVSAGCGSAAQSIAGFLNPETALKNAGPGLREICEAIGIPPILHLGSCVDNSRILTILSAMAEEGGLSDETGGMPVAGIAPEWMSEEAAVIGFYFAASGIPVIFGGESSASDREITKIMSDLWFKRFKGALVFETDHKKILAMTLDYIDKARLELKLKKYESGRFGTERVLMDMAARREQKQAAKPHMGIY